MAIALANDDVTNSIPRRVNGVDATVWTTTQGGPANDGIFTPGVGSLLMAFMFGQPDTNEPTSVTGNGATYTHIVSNGGIGAAAVYLYAADSGSSPSSGATTATWATTRTGMHLYVLEFTGVDMSGGVAAAFGATNTGGSGTPGTSRQITLVAAGNAANRSVSFFGMGANEAMTGDPDAGTWVTIHQQGHGAENNSALVQWRTDAYDTDHDCSWTTSVANAGIAVEIKASLAGGAVVLDPFGMTGFFGS